jgi:putative heme iron utilization protein
MSEESISNQELARSLMVAGGSAALATLNADGGPFVSYVVTAQDADGSPLMLFSRLAEHTQNLERDPRASLLFVCESPPGEQKMTATRLTVRGRCVRHADAAAKTLYLARHPEAERYAGFSDFSLFRFEIAAGHMVAGFGRIVGLSREDLLDGTSAG